MGFDYSFIRQFFVHKYSVHPPAICRHLNEEESSNARLAYDDGQLFSSLEIVDKTWTQGYYATDDCDTSEGELSVQGWPPEWVFLVCFCLFSKAFVKSTAFSSCSKKIRVVFPTFSDQCREMFVFCS